MNIRYPDTTGRISRMRNSVRSGWNSHPGLGVQNSNPMLFLSFSATIGQLAQSPVHSQLEVRKTPEEKAGDDGVYRNGNFEFSCQIRTFAVIAAVNGTIQASGQRRGRQSTIVPFSLPTNVHILCQVFVTSRHRASKAICAPGPRCKITGWEGTPSIMLRRLHGSLQLPDVSSSPLTVL